MTAAVATNNPLPLINETKIDEFGAYEQGILLHNRYRKIADIQAGSYGRVSVAHDTATNTQVAVKAMSKKVQGVSAVARHEVSILKRLGKHENICALLDCFETSSHYFLVFEHCAHGDLYDYLQRQDNHLNPSRRNGTPALFKQFVKELVAAVNFAHSRGVYHRDIKPENILIDAHGSVKLTDWGLATVCSKCFDPCIGTEKYMAPETFFRQSSKSKSRISYDAIKADYWSVGVTMLYVLFGKCPFKLANVSDADFSDFVNTPGFLLDKYPTLTVHGHDAVMQVLQLNPTHRSLDACLEVLTRDYTAPLTTEQIVEQDNEAAVQFSDDIFAFDEDDDDNDDGVPSLDESDNMFDHHHHNHNFDGSTSSSFSPTSLSPTMAIKTPGVTENHQTMAPPSLIESVGMESLMGKSWAEIDEWDVESFNFCVPKSLKTSKVQTEKSTAPQSVLRGEHVWY
ncbi:CYFA0S01e00738g1_1 [Cyberlindnera fabianii]|uniref:non-specific serine/threonine protein kinase n=1 Tax=Cyberlindnera fabianii TaxID=36022 RepID=A0A061AFM4_CYBFA|nr:putative serine/threonine-protein kinase FMP48 [Cyberlindnera fabianii]CDR36349.1 CYFA0S01e00738g1_1 [Cyberlindnera fabianii]